MADADRIWKALSDPTRRAMLDLLAEGPRTTGDLCARFERAGRDRLGRTGVLKHLDLLRDTRLILTRRDGRVRWNSLNPAPIQLVCDRWVSRHVRGATSALLRLKQAAEERGPARADAALPVGSAVAGGPAGSLRVSTLRGERIALRRVAPDRDADALYECAHGTPRREAVWTYMGYGPFADRSAMHTWLEQCAASTDPLFLTVHDRGARTPIGMASFLAIDRSQRRVELGHIWYGPGAQRSTANTEAVYLMLREAFARHYRRVEWKCDALNQRSRAAALRLGFTFEGLFRQHLIVKGRNRDTAWFSMVDSEWEPAREALETWLQWKDDDRPPLASLRG